MELDFKTETESGVLPAGWEWKKLGEVINLIRGVTYKPSDLVSAETKDAVACFRTKNVQTVLDLDDVNFIPRALAKGKFLQNGDLLISSANSLELLGKSCTVNDLPYVATLGGFICAARAKPNLISPKFLFYFFSSERTLSKLRSLSNKTTGIANLPLKKVEEVQIPLPPLAEQQRIVAKLDALFARIDEAIALTEGALKSIQNLLPAALDEVFGQAEEKGWEMKKLSDVVHINSGIALPAIFKEPHNDGTFEFFKVAQMNNDSKYMKGAEFLFSKETGLKNKIKIFPKGSVLIPKRGGAISTNKKRLLLTDASYDSNIMGLKAKNHLLSDDYLFVLMNSIDLSDFVDEATIPQINNKHIERMAVSIPSLEKQQSVVSYLSRIEKLKHDSQKGFSEKLGQLKALKQSLLEATFSGEL